MKAKCPKCATEFDVSSLAARAIVAARWKKTKAADRSKAMSKIRQKGLLRQRMPNVA